MYNGVGGSAFYLVIPKHPMEMKLFGLIETKLFHFIRFLKTGGGGGGGGG